MAGLTHYCPGCGAFSYHDEGQGARAWALKCPHCDHVAPQHPHPPEAGATSAPVATETPSPARAAAASASSSSAAAEAPGDVAAEGSDRPARRKRRSGE